MCAIDSSETPENYVCDQKSQQFKGLYEKWSKRMHAVPYYVP